MENENGTMTINNDLNMMEYEIEDIKNMEEEDIFLMHLQNRELQCYHINI